MDDGPDVTLDLAAMRVRYASGTLHRRDLPATPLEAFRLWFAEAEAAGVLEPNAMTLATADADGAPSARTVLCKDVGPRGFVFYTNMASRKGRDLADNPRAALVFPWLAMSRQIVVTGEVEPVTRGEVLAYFHSRPHDHQLGAAASEQSTVVESRAALDARADALAAAHPPGTDVPLPPTWGGYVVHPVSLELWAGRVSRLHDRLRYRRVDPDAPVSMSDPDGWVLERLSP